MTSCTNILRTVLLTALLFAGVVTLSAQSPAEGSERGKILEQLKPYRHKFIVKELDLTKEQSQEFLPLYDAMDEQLAKIGDETRELEKSAAENADASDTELQAAARALYEQKVREGNVELEYFEKFKDILTPRQLLKLKDAERKFNQSLLRHHRRLTRDKDKR